jgi:single-stranded-DNA-specific exonuclease
MPRAVARTLARRGWGEEVRLGEYLNPRLDRLADPRVLDGMDRAVERVERAIESGETILVHGDYDVDGITGTAFLVRTLRSVGARVVPFIPGRADGYGLGERGLEAAREAGATVLITVDTGIRAVAAVDRANTMGLDVVILDHHELGDRLPEAYAVVNPLRGESGAPFRNLAAVGVAAKFMHALALSHPRPALREAYRDALQLVALGTIADLVPLTGENRILVCHGLRQLAASEWAGVKALKAVAGLQKDRLRASDVAFFLAPRLNAAGRLGNPGDALALLLADEPAEAYRLAQLLEERNQARRRIEETMAAEAMDAVRTAGEPPAAIVLWSEAWPRGLVGVVASRLLERLGRPVFLISLDAEGGRGSARSVPGFPLPEALTACADLLEEHGGHAEAAGFGIRRDRLEAFRDRMGDLAARASLGGEPPPLEIDAGVGLDEMTAECVGWLERLAPFGRGNSEPLFAGEGFVLAEPPVVVGKRHLKLSLSQGRVRLRAVAFNHGARVGELERGQSVDVAFHAGFDTWRGGNAVELVIRDLRIR